MREIYTDGSCQGNPWPGGWAVMMRSEDDQKNSEEKNIILSWGEILTTNNQMELQAVIEALQRVSEYSEGSEPPEKKKIRQKEMLEGIGLFADESEAQIEEEIHLRTDSNYVKLGVTKWLSTWKRRNWRRAKGGKLIENLQHWQRLDQLLAYFTHLHRHWIKGHAGNACNEKVDRLAKRAVEGMNNF